MGDEHQTGSSQDKQIGWAGLTDVGKVRQANEDAFAADPSFGLFLVSDGMGGHQAGALASKIVATVLPQMIRERLNRAAEPSTRSLNAWLKADVLELSRRLRSESIGRPDLHGMGATLVMAFVRGSKAHIVHMGDSRAYLLRGGRLKQLTQDHSIVGILLRQGGITQEEARNHPARGQISRYLGMEGEVFPGLQVIDLKQDDRLLLCSDGLSGPVSDDDLARLLSANQDPATACRALIDAANAAGGSDNITAVIIDYQAPPH